MPQGMTRAHKAQKDREERQAISLDRLLRQMAANEGKRLSDEPKPEPTTAAIVAAAGGRPAPRQPLPTRGGSRLNPFA